VRAKLAYLLPALVAWGGVYAAGVHPTIAGVAIGLLTPVRAWLGPSGFLHGVHPELERLAGAEPGALSSHELAASLRHIDAARREVLSPAESLIETLHPWVAFGIMPLFALANAGVSIAGGSLGGAASAVCVAVAAGLVLGKPLGVVLACWAALGSGLGALPVGLSWRHLWVLGVVAGIGFTMALFVAQLAFADAWLLGAAKLGVLGASGAAALLALGLGRLLLEPVRVAGAAETADEAEGSTEK
jgi:Na+:H+ antiporter, NhaA family